MESTSDILCVSCHLEAPDRPFVSMCINHVPILQNIQMMKSLIKHSARLKIFYKHDIISQVFAEKVTSQQT